MKFWLLNLIQSLTGYYDSDVSRFIRTILIISNETKGIVKVFFYAQQSVAVKNDLESTFLNQSTASANVNRGLNLVTSDHPSLNSCFPHFLQSFLNSLLQAIFNGCGPYNFKISLNNIH